MDFNVFVRICLFLLKLVKASHFPSELSCFAVKHARVHTPSVPIYTDGSKSSEGVGCATVFSDFLRVRLSSCSCFDLYSGIISYFPRPFSYFVPLQ